MNFAWQLADRNTILLFEMVPLEFACVTVMCERRGSNPILITFVLQMRGRLCPYYNSDSYVVQLNIKNEKLLWRQNFPAQKRIRAKPSRRQKIGT